jgi:hypothetical protein
MVQLIRASLRPCGRSSSRLGSGSSVARAASIRLGDHRLTDWRCRASWEVVSPCTISGVRASEYLASSKTSQWIAEGLAAAGLRCLQIDIDYRMEGSDNRGQEMRRTCSQRIFGGQGLSSLPAISRDRKGRASTSEEISAIIFSAYQSISRGRGRGGRGGA